MYVPVLVSQLGDRLSARDPFAAKKVDRLDGFSLGAIVEDTISNLAVCVLIRSLNMKPGHTHW